MFFELNDLLNQVNEEEEDQNVPDLEDDLANLANAVHMEEIQVDLPILDGPAVNVLPLEIQEADLMNEEEIQQQIQEEIQQNGEMQQNGPHNLQVRMVLINNVQMPPFPAPSLAWEKPWAKFFCPEMGSIPQYLVPLDWANFFSAMLLSPGHFVKAKELMKVKGLLPMISSLGSVGFSLPDKCPVKKPISCCSLAEIEQEMSESEQEITNVDPSEAPPVEKEIMPVKVKGKNKIVLVESELRRSPRLLHNNRGFYNPICKEKLCVGCNSKPPTLSPDVIRNLCTSLCDVDESLVGDEALKKKRRTVTPVGGNMQFLEEATSAAPASKKKIEKTSSGAPSKTRNHKAKKPAPEDVGSADPYEA
jgi:hypothetical protein